MAKDNTSTKAKLSLVEELLKPDSVKDLTCIAESSDWKALVLSSTKAARAKVPWVTAQKHAILALSYIKGIAGENLILACSNKPSEEVKQLLRFSLECDCDFIEFPAPTIERALYAAYHGDDDYLAFGLTKLKLADTKNTQSRLTLVQNFTNTDIAFCPETGDAAIFLAKLINYALAKGASDIHLAPRFSGTHLRLRINNKIQEVKESLCALETHRQIISRLKILAKLDITNVQTPQDGRFEIPAENDQKQNYFARLSTLPTVYGEKAVIRLMGQGGLVNLQDLGLETQIYEILQKTIKNGASTVVISGATGSGKSTTLYALMQKLASEGKIIASAEDPVERIIPEISQTNVSDKQSVNFSQAIRAMLRQDPDVLVVGEMRDEESAKLGFQAALTGHLLLTSVHAGSAEQTLLRILQLGVDPLTVAQTLKLIINQKLFSRLCTHCRVTDLNYSRKAGFEVFQPSACSHCDYTGFSGVVLASEALIIDPELCEGLESKQAKFSDCFNTGNFFPLKRSIYRLLKEGLIIGNH